MPPDRAELESLSTKELHDRAVRAAIQHLDVGFLWELAKTVPAAEAAAGHLDEAKEDVLKLSALLNDWVHAGDGEVGEALRPLYLGYLEAKG